MGKDEYLAELGALLTGQMSSREIDGILNYYEEYFREVGPDGEEGLIAELGSPEQLAAHILGRPVGDDPDRQSAYIPPEAEPWEAPGQAPAVRYGAPPVIVGICLIFSACILLIIAFSLLLGLGLGGVICAITGIGLLIGGAFAGGFSLFTGLAVRLCLGGAGLLVGGLGLLLLLGGICAFRGIWHAAIGLIHRAKGGDSV